MPTATTTSSSFQFVDGVAVPVMFVPVPVLAAPVLVTSAADEVRRPLNSMRAAAFAVMLCAVEQLLWKKLIVTVEPLAIAGALWADRTNVCVPVAAPLGLFTTVLSWVRLVAPTEPVPHIVPATFSAATVKTRLSPLVVAEVVVKVRLEPAVVEFPPPRLRTNALDGAVTYGVGRGASSSASSSVDPSRGS